jgi:dipeptidase E
MVTIIAIGGGEIGRPRRDGKGNHLMETIPIDKEVIRQTGKKHPHLVFLPTATGDPPSYTLVIEKYYGKKFGCTVEPLYVRKNPPSRTQIIQTIQRADIIYVGGGNTLAMMKAWRRIGLQKILVQHAKKNVVLAGVSAGAICWFTKGNSDSWKIKNPQAPYIQVRGIGLLPFTACPHYHTEPGRPKSLQAMIRKYGGIGLGIDNKAAFEVVNDTYRILTSSPEAKVYLVRRIKGKIREIEVTSSKAFKPLSDLLGQKTAVCS